MADAPRRDDQPPAPATAEPAPADRPPPVAAGLDRFGFAGLNRHAGLGRWIAMNALLRDRERTGLPADAARSLGGDDGFRALMEPVRATARAMVDRGDLQVTQSGEVVDPRTARGAIRLRLPPV